MKAIILSTTLLAGAAQAGTFIPMQTPGAVAPTVPATTQCVAAVFNTDGSVSGTCTTHTYSVCSGRGCQPLRHNKLYVANWDRAGNALSATLCATYDSHPPAVFPVVYQPGFDATNCAAVNTSLDPHILIGNYWYTLVSVSADGAYEAVVGYGVPYLVEF